jgi:hypothetical protein
LKVEGLLGAWTLFVETLWIVENACFDAFVIFFHPDSKYAGPGTDQVVARNTIITVYVPTPPKSSKELKISKH